MFTNLIESQSHKKDFKRRGSFVMMTMAAYALFFVFAGVLSIYAYDAQLETQEQELELLSFVPPVIPPVATVRPVRTPPRPTGNDSGPVRPARVPVLLEDSSNPRTAPDKISAAAQPIPPARDHTRLDPNVFDPGSNGAGTEPIGRDPGGSGGDENMVGNIGEPPAAKVTERPSRPPTVQRKVINGLAVSLPTPPYPILAKQIGMQGVVSVQVLLDESGKVVSAKAVSGHPTLTRAAVDAAYRARFSPTLIGNQAVKVSGIITYNFTLH